MFTVQWFQAQALTAKIINNLKKLNLAISVKINPKTISVEQEAEI